MRYLTTLLTALSVSLTVVACVTPAATPTASPDTVTTSIFEFNPPSGWPTAVHGDAVFVVSHGDAQAIERDRALATPETLWIWINPTSIGPDMPLAEFAANFWRSEDWIEAGGNSALALENVPLRAVAPVSLGDFAGVQSERSDPEVIWRQYLLDVAPGQALQVTLRLPPDHAGIDAALAAVQSLRRAPSEP